MSIPQLQQDLLYAALAGLAISLGLHVARMRKAASWAYYLGGFLLAAASVVLRGLHARHMPLRNLYEVFLFMAMAMPLLTIFCRRLLGVGGEPWDVLVALLLLIPPGFILSAEMRPLPPVLQSPFFVPHVLAYVLACAVLAKGTVQALAVLAGRDAPPRPGLAAPAAAMHRAICLGFPLLTLGLVTGACWGKAAWGDYWNWDPKELWSLATWLIYAGYFHVRAATGAKRPDLDAIQAVAGFVAIVITLLWVNLAKLFPGLHSYAF